VAAPTWEVAERGAGTVTRLAYSLTGDVDEALGWPIGTVRSRVHRGRRALRTERRPGTDAT
jgi:hypothetical protein